MRTNSSIPGNSRGNETSRACLKTLVDHRVRARGLPALAKKSCACRPGALTGRVFKPALTLPPSPLQNSFLILPPFHLGWAAPQRGPTHPGRDALPRVRDLSLAPDRLTRSRTSHPFPQGARTFSQGKLTHPQGVHTHDHGARTFSKSPLTLRLGKLTFSPGAPTLSPGARTLSSGARTLAKGARPFSKGVPQNPAGDRTRPRVPFSAPSRKTPDGPKSSAFPAAPFAPHRAGCEGASNHTRGRVCSPNHFRRGHWQPGNPASGFATPPRKLRPRTANPGRQTSAPPH